MKLICPGCGAVASSESWVNDAHCRETLAVITNLPVPLTKSVLGYLSLFRPGQRSLSWKKALRLAKEIEQLVSLGYVKVQGKVDRNCPPSLWARAMEQMVEQRAALRLPMPNHNYLKKIVWDLADQADYKVEKKHNAPQMKNRTRQGSGTDPQFDPLQKARDEWDRKFKNGELNVDSNNLSGVVKEMD